MVSVLIRTKIIYYMDEVDRLVSGEEVFPPVIEVCPSNRCLNRCNFCMFEKYLAENRVDLPLDAYRKLLICFKDIGVQSITFGGGGEPLMNKNIEKMMTETLDSGMAVGLLTNGVDLDRIFGIMHRLTFIRISLDCATRGTYKRLKGRDGFKRVIDHIRLATIKAHVSLSFVVTDDNRNEIDQAKELALGLGVDYIRFKQAYGKEFGKDASDGDDIASFAPQDNPSGDLPCKISGLIGIVGAEGNIYYCCHKIGANDGVLGNVITENLPFWEIWKRRYSVNPDRSRCVTCRYMNYANEYIELSKGSNIHLRHRRFL